MASTYEVVFVLDVDARPVRDTTPVTAEDGHPDLLLAFDLLLRGRVRHVAVRPTNLPRAAADMAARSTPRSDEQSARRPTTLQGPVTPGTTGGRERGGGVEASP
jgi:hypothetical protein